MAYLTRAPLNVDDIFNQLFAPTPRCSTGNVKKTAKDWTPHVNLRETEAGYTILAELPGLTTGDVEIEFQDDTLTLKGSRAQVERTEGETWHLLERRHGSFERSFRFPTAIDVESFSATFKHGLLTIEVGKAAEVKPRKIEIKLAE